MLEETQKQLGEALQSFQEAETTNLTLKNDYQLTLLRCKKLEAEADKKKGDLKTALGQVDVYQRYHVELETKVSSLAGEL